MYRDGRDAALARVRAAQVRWRECYGSTELDSAGFDARLASSTSIASIASMVAAAEAYEARTARTLPRTPSPPPDPLAVAKRNYGAALSEWYSLARRLRQARTRILADAAAQLRVSRRVDLDALLRNRPRPPREDEVAYRVATAQMIVELERMRDLLEPNRRTRADRQRRALDAARAQRAHVEGAHARLRRERDRVSMTLMLVALGGMVTFAFAYVATLAGLPPWAGITLALYFGLTIPSSLGREKSRAWPCGKSSG